MSATQRVVIIEGFTDRAFVTGILKRLGCVSLGASDSRLRSIRGKPR